MKTTNWWKTVFIMCMMAMAIIACGDDNDDPKDDGNNGNGTEQKGDYTATTSVKEAKIGSMLYNCNYGSEGHYKIERGPVVYEDFNHLYQIALNQGNIILLHYVRENGWWNPVVNSNNYTDKTQKSLLLDKGKVVNIQAISVKAIYESGNWTNSLQAQPNHGYAAFFTTEDGEIKYLRIYIKDYTLDNAGSLSDITVQYQLY